MSEDIVCRIEAGQPVSDFEIARFLGWAKNGHHWVDPDEVRKARQSKTALPHGGIRPRSCPAFSSSLDALSREIERRGWIWWKEMLPEAPACVVCTPGPHNRAFGAVAGIRDERSHADTVRALLVALLRTVEKVERDHAKCDQTEGCQG